MCGVLGHLAPVDRCACLLCCGACAGRRCGTHTRPSGRRLFRCRQGLGTLRARTRPSGRRLFCSRQGHGTLRASTRPSGRRLFSSRRELGSLPRAHTSIRTAAGRVLVLAWSGGPASRARSGASHMSCCRFAFLSAPSACACASFFLRPLRVCFLVVSGPGCPPPPSLSLFFFCAPLVSAAPLFPLLRGFASYWQDTTSI